MKFCWTQLRRKSMTNLVIQTGIQDSKDIPPMDMDSSFLMTCSEFLKRITLIIPSLDGKILLKPHFNFFNRYQILHQQNITIDSMLCYTRVITVIKWNTFPLAATFTNNSS